jgi:hypothetical protein
MFVPYDESVGIHLQDDEFLSKKPWTLRILHQKISLLLNFHPLVIYRHNVIKQADIVLAMFLLGNQFSLCQKRRNFDYYDPLTTGDSSLSVSIQSILAMELGLPRQGHRVLEVCTLDGPRGQVPLDEALLGSRARGVDVLDLDKALSTLTEFDPRKGRVVELRYFGGLSVEETAKVLQVSSETVLRDWRMAKTWLFHELTATRNTA